VRGDPKDRLHLIRRGDVARWLADSVVKVVTFHRTSSHAATVILEQGVTISASRIASFGQGFYTATRTDPMLGPVEIAVAIRTRQR
jgi:hypothetical protein